MEELGEGLKALKGMGTPQPNTGQSLRKLMEELGERIMTPKGK